MSELVSIIIPSYNHERFVLETIQSVINQTYPNIQLIVLDDGSKDGSPELLKQASIRYGFELVLKQNEGICSTLNRGIDMARGEFLVFIASDDFMPTNRITEQVEFLKSHADVDVVTGSVCLIDINSKELNYKNLRKAGRLQFDEMLRRNMVFAPTAMFKKNVFTRFGKYNPNFAFEDYYMWLRILSQGGVIENVEKMWAYYRINSSAYEKRFNWYLKGNEQILREYAQDEQAIESIKMQYVKFGIKMGLFLGPESLEKYQTEFSKVPFFWKLIIQTVVRLPRFFRHTILDLLIKNV